MYGLLNVLEMELSTLEMWVVPQHLNTSEKLGFPGLFSNRYGGEPTGSDMYEAQTLGCGSERESVSQRPRGLEARAI